MGFDLRPMLYSNIHVISIWICNKILSLRSSVCISSLLFTSSCHDVLVAMKCLSCLCSYLLMRNDNSYFLMTCNRYPLDLNGELECKIELSTNCFKRFSIIIKSIITPEPFLLLGKASNESRRFRLTRSSMESLKLTSFPCLTVQNLI